MDFFDIVVFFQRLDQFVHGGRRLGVRQGHGGERQFRDLRTSHLMSLASSALCTVLQIEPGWSDFVAVGVRHKILRPRLECEFHERILVRGIACDVICPLR